MLNYSSSFYSSSSSSSSLTPLSQKDNRLLSCSRLSIPNLRYLSLINTSHLSHVILHIIFPYSRGSPLRSLFVGWLGILSWCFMSHSSVVDVPFCCTLFIKKCTLVQALRLCTGRTAHRGSRGIALLFHDHGTRKG